MSLFTVMTPRKRFGQHFLHDKHVVQQIVDLIAPRINDHLVEIGPGMGALTAPVLKKIGTLHVIEIDRDLIPLLEARCQSIGKLFVHEADALEFDLLTLKNNKKLRLFGNLPYNISTPLIFHLLKYAELITDMHFMLQKEVTDRLAAPPNTTHYGRLSVMVQYHCQVTQLFDVPPGAFHPPPKVYSSIVRLVPFPTLPFVARDYGLFEQLVKQAFAQRRKTIRNCLKTMVSDDIWQQVDIDSSRRGEELTVEEYVKLSNLL